MQIVYEGPHDAVEIAGTDVVAERGKAVEVDDKVAASLLEQETWREAASKKTSARDAADTKE